MVPWVGDAGAEAIGVNFITVVTVVLVAAMLPAVILPTVDIFPALAFPDTTNDCVIVLAPTVKFAVEIATNPVIVVAKPRVMAPLGVVVVKLVPAMVTEVTPVFTMVIVPPAVELPSPAPVTRFAEVNEVASLNTLVKLS